VREAEGELEAVPAVPEAVKNSDLVAPVLTVPDRVEEAETQEVVVPNKLALPDCEGVSEAEELTEAVPPMLPDGKPEADTVVVTEAERLPLLLLLTMALRVPHVEAVVVPAVEALPLPLAEGEALLLAVNATERVAHAVLSTEALTLTLPLPLPPGDCEGLSEVETEEEGVWVEEGEAAPEPDGDTVVQALKETPGLALLEGEEALVADPEVEAVDCSDCVTEEEVEGVAWEESELLGL
jgi:hypothetical protein